MGNDGYSGDLIAEDGREAVAGDEDVAQCADGLLRQKSVDGRRERLKGLVPVERLPEMAQRVPDGHFDETLFDVVLFGRTEHVGQVQGVVAVVHQLLLLQ